VIPDASFELPRGWEGAAFAQRTAVGTELTRPQPRGVHVIRCLERAGERIFGIWDPASGRMRGVLDGAADAHWALDGAGVIVATEDAWVRTLGWPALTLRNEARLDFGTSAGVAGVELVLSPMGDAGVVHFYSGQSEEGFAVFSLPELVTMSRLPYVSGESACPCVFSPDGRYVVLVTEPYAMWWAGDDEADWDTPAAGGRMPWATIHVHEVRPQGLRDQVAVFVEVPLGWVPPEEIQCASWPRNLRFTAAARLAFDAPWGGTCETDFPPPGSCDAPPPSV